MQYDRQSEAHILLKLAISLFIGFDNSERFTKIIGKVPQGQDKDFLHSHIQRSLSFRILWESDTLVQICLAQRKYQKSPTSCVFPSELVQDGQVSPKWSKISSLTGAVFSELYQNQYTSPKSFHVKEWAFSSNISVNIFQQAPSHLSAVMSILLPYSYKKSNEIHVSFCGWTRELWQIALWLVWWQWQRIHVLTSCHSLWVLRCTHSQGNFSLKHLTTDLEMILNIL